MKIKIGWMNIKIKYVKDLHNGENKCDGYFSPQKHLICVEKNLPNNIQKQILYHEIIHGIFYVYGRHNDNQDENLVDLLASAFMTLEVDNRAVIKSLLSE